MDATRNFPYLKKIGEGELFQNVSLIIHTFFFKIDHELKFQN